MKLKSLELMPRSSENIPVEFVTVYRAMYGHKWVHYINEDGFHEPETNGYFQYPEDRIEDAIMEGVRYSAEMELPFCYDGLMMTFE